MTLVYRSNSYWDTTVWVLCDQLNGAVFCGAVEQIVGRERRERLSQLVWSGDA